MFLAQRSRGEGHTQRRQPLRDCGAKLEERGGFQRVKRAFMRPSSQVAFLWPRTNALEFQASDGLAARTRAGVPLRMRNLYFGRSASDTKAKTRSATEPSGTFSSFMASSKP